MSWQDDHPPSNRRPAAANQSPRMAAVETIRNTLPNATPSKSTHDTRVRKGKPLDSLENILLTLLTVNVDENAYAGAIELLRTRHTDSRLSKDMPGRYLGQHLRDPYHGSYEDLAAAEQAISALDNMGPATQQEAEKYGYEATPTPNPKSPWAR